MGDVAVTPVPDAGQLAQIAVCTARTARAVAGLDPKVALLSFSTKGSALFLYFQNPVQKQNNKK